MEKETTLDQPEVTIELYPEEFNNTLALAWHMFHTQLPNHNQFTPDNFVKWLWESEESAELDTVWFANPNKAGTLMDGLLWKIHGFEKPTGPVFDYFTEVPGEFADWHDLTEDEAWVLRWCKARFVWELLHNTDVIISPLLRERWGISIFKQFSAMADKNPQFPRVVRTLVWRGDDQRTESNINEWLNAIVNVANRRIERKKSL